MNPSTISRVTLFPAAGLLWFASAAAASEPPTPKQLMKVTYHLKAPITGGLLTVKHIPIKNLKPTDRITLPNGQTVVVSDYLKSLNALEAKLNKIGYSLKAGHGKDVISEVTADPAVVSALQKEIDSKIAPGTDQSLEHFGGVLKNAPLKFNLSDYDTSKMSAADRSALSSAINAFNSKNFKGDLRDGIATNMKQLANLNVKNAFTLSGSELNSIKYPPKPLPKAQNIPFSDSYNYNWSPGCGIATINLNYSAAYNGNVYITPQKSYDLNKSSMAVVMSGDLSISVGPITNYDLLRLNAIFGGGGGKPSSASMLVFFHGNLIYNKGDNLRSGGGFGDTAALPFDTNYDYSFPVAPGIFVDGRFGMNGAVGVSYGGMLYGEGIYTEVTPFAKVSAYAQAAIGAGFVVSGVPFGVDAGIKCNLVLIDDQLTLGVNTGLGYNGCIGLTEELYVKNKLNVLKGKLTGFVNVPYMHEYDFSIFDFQGFQQNATLYYKKNFTPMGIHL